MPRAEGRPRREPLRDVENCLIEYLIIGHHWEKFKCDCCDAPFDGTGWLMDPELNRVEPRDAWDRPEVTSGYGSVICDAVRVRRGEDFEYKPGSWSGKACPACTRRIELAWIVMPGEAPDA